MIYLVYYNTSGPLSLFGISPALSTFIYVHIELICDNLVLECSGAFNPILIYLLLQITGALCPGSPRN
jgi:hypothetical protein